MLVMACLLIGAHALPASVRTISSKPVSKIEFDGTPLRDAIEYIRTKSAELDPMKRGLNILVDPAVDLETPITLSLRDVPLGAVVGYVTEFAGVAYRVETHAVRIVPGSSSANRGSGGPHPETSSKARGLVISSVEFDDTSLEEAIRYLTEKSIELDPGKKGLNLLLGRGVDPSTPVSLRLKNVPLSNVLGYVADYTGLKLRADRYAILVERSAPKKPEGD